MTTINNINHAIMFGNFTNEQIDSIIMAVKFRRNELAKHAKRSVTIGCQVRFISSRTGKNIVGNVSKINRKTVIVREVGTVTSWRVPANMLEAVKEKTK